MEELSLQAKIIGGVLCIAAVFLLSAHDVIKLLRRSPKSNKTK